MDTLIKTGGFYCIALIIFHLLFWKIFNWREELPRLNRLNRATLQVLNLSITFVFLLFAYLSLVHTNELLTTPLGRSLCGLIAAFWLFRAAQQIVFYQLKHWVSWSFLGLFLLGAALYGMPVFYVS
jgi:hypothetical protein